MVRSTKPRAESTTVSVALSSIKRARISRGLTVRDLAAMLHVTPGAISQLERSEAAGKIRMDKLRNALAHMGTELVVTTARPGTASAPSHRAPYARREDRVTYEIHRAIAKKLIDDPDAVTAIALSNIAALHEHVRGDLAHEWVEQWRDLLQGPVGTIIDVMLGHDNLAKELRQNSPFTGVLTQAERAEAIQRAVSR
jgi:transcriptional regulator with XRE-family HTH domain